MKKITTKSTTKSTIKAGQPMQGSVWEIMQQLKFVASQKNDQSMAQSNMGDLWESEAYLTVIDNLENAKKSMATLIKHLPARFHPLIRFAQPKITWYLNVEKGVTAAQLNMLLDDLLFRIAKDIGYAPRLRVVVQPSRWTQSGFPLVYPEKMRNQLPDDNEADAIIANFLGRRSNK